MKKVIVCLIILMLFGFVEMRAQQQDEILDTVNIDDKGYRRLNSKISSTQEDIPLTSLSLDLAKDPNVAFKLKLFKVDFNKNKPKKIHRRIYGSIDGKLKSNNGYATIINGGKFDADFQLGSDFSLILHEKKVTDKGYDPCLKVDPCGDPIKKQPKVRKYFIFWLNVTADYQHSEFTLVSSPAQSNIVLKSHIKNQSYDRFNAGISAHLLNHFKDSDWSIYTKVGYDFKYLDNNSSVLPTVKVTQSNTYYDTLRKEVVVIEREPISGKMGIFETFSSHNINWAFTLFRESLNSKSKIALNINSTLKIPGNGSKSIWALEGGVYFPIEQLQKDAKSTLVNIGVIVGLSDILLEREKNLSKLFNVGVKINVPFPIKKN